MPDPTRRLIRFTTGFLFVGFGALMAIVAMNLWFGQKAQSNFRDAMAARETRVAAVELRSAIQTAESSQRGFIITGNEIYLAPYDSTKTQVKSNRAVLQLSLSSYSGGPLILERLTEILATKYAEFDRIIALKRAGRDDEVIAIMRTNFGKTLTDEANLFFSGIIAKADNRLATDLTEAQTNALRLRLVSIIGALVIVAVIWGAGYFTRQYTQEITTTRDRIKGLNDELEDRVSARTADLVHSRDRAQILLFEVNHRVANSLAIVSSLINLQSKELINPEAKDALAVARDRVIAIAHIHKRLYETGDPSLVSLDKYLEGLLDQLTETMLSHDRGIKLTHTLERVELDVDACINLGVVITELITNAFKYAYPDGAGEVRVSLHLLDDGNAALVVEDDGVGRSVCPRTNGTGLGTKIINTMCTSMGGRIDYWSRQPGTTARLIFSPKGNKLRGYTDHLLAGKS